MARRSETGTVAYAAGTPTAIRTGTESAAPEHFLLLDALRGVAAVAVLCLHWFEGLGSLWFGGARLAVDFFFLLSGFVMDHAYTERLKQGLGFGRFFVLRVIRLWPMIAAGAVVGLLRELMRGAMSHDPDFSLTTTVFRFFLNLFLVPDIFSGPDAMHFPLNIAMWSLLAEFIAYVMFGLFAYRASRHTLAAILVVSGTAVAIWLIGYFKTMTGSYFPGTGYVFDTARAIFSFTLGVALYRLRDRLPALIARPWICASVLFGIMLVPFDHMIFAIIPVSAALLVIVFPVIVLAGAQARLEGRTARAASLLGDLSYPLYAVHTPLIWLIGGGLSLIAAKAHLDLPKVAMGIVALPLTAACAYLLLRFYDEPLRRYLGRLYHRSKSLKTAP